MELLTNPLNVWIIASAFAGWSLGMHLELMKNNRKSTVITNDVER